MECFKLPTRRVLFSPLSWPVNSVFQVDSLRELWPNFFPNFSTSCLLLTVEWVKTGAPDAFAACCTDLFYFIPGLTVFFQVFFFKQKKAHRMHMLITCYFVILPRTYTMKKNFQFQFTRWEGKRNLVKKRIHLWWSRKNDMEVICHGESRNGLVCRENAEDEV